MLPAKRDSTHSDLQVVVEYPRLLSIEKRWYPRPIVSACIYILTYSQIIPRCLQDGLHSIYGQRHDVAPTIAVFSTSCSIDDAPGIHLQDQATLRIVSDTPQDRVSVCSRPNSGKVQHIKTIAVDPGETISVYLWLMFELSPMIARCSDRADCIDLTHRSAGGLRSPFICQTRGLTQSAEVMRKRHGYRNCTSVCVCWVGGVHTRTGKSTRP